MELMEDIAMIVIRCLRRNALLLETNRKSYAAAAAIRMQGG